MTCLAALAVPSRSADEIRRLRVEMIGLYVGVPMLLISGAWPMAWRMPLLAAVTVLTIALAVRGAASLEQIGVPRDRVDGFYRTLAGGLAVWIAGFLALSVPQVASGSDVLFPLLRLSSERVAGVFGVYLLSVIAQEWLYRGFFFWRYRDAASPATLAAFNVLAFAGVHLIYGSWLSVALSAAGGVVFTLLYLRHRSLLAVTVVHAVLGLTIFAMGFGRLFYAGPLPI
jgi:membrane protease YdiL (CAAX protease family)